MSYSYNGASSRGAYNSGYQPRSYQPTSYNPPSYSSGATDPSKTGYGFASNPPSQQSAGQGNQGYQAPGYSAGYQPNYTAGGQQHPNNQYGGYYPSSQTHQSTPQNQGYQPYTPTYHPTNQGGSTGAPSNPYSSYKPSYQPNYQPSSQPEKQPPSNNQYAPYKPTYTPSSQRPREQDQKALETKANVGKSLFKEAFNASASPVSYGMMLRRLQTTGEVHRDEEFPPTINSLCGEDRRKAAKWSRVTWRTPTEFWGSGFEVFQGSVEPNDIKQGQLGDCYFLSTLSAMAEWPKRIEDLFPEKKANEHGCYMVRICDMGEWKEIVVDDLFPCKNDRSGPIFTRGNEHELWVLILEKAWAKIYGSYAKLEAGLTREVLHDLTGGPTEYFTDQDDANTVWDALYKGEQMNFIMTAGSGDFMGGSDLLASSGLVGSHAYSLLSAVDIMTDNGEVRLVKLRNPWGESEWKGDWSDESPTWTPTQLKEKVGLQDVDDGAFYMSFDDFRKYFSDVQICRVHDDYKYSAHRFTVEANHASYIRFTIHEKGHYYITINQKSKRHFLESENYQYSDVFLIIGRENGQDFEYVQGIQRADREVWTDGDMEPGNYIAYVKVLWYDSQAHDIVISSYGIGEAEFSSTSKEEFGGHFLEKVYTSKAVQSENMKSYKDEGEENALRCAELTDDGFGYFFFWNKSQATLNTQIYFKVMSGIKLRKPFRGKKFDLTVAPGEKQIVITKVNPYYEVKQVYAEHPTFQRNEQQLQALAKETGQRKQRKNQKTQEMVEIYCYILQHSDGIYFYYENNTPDLLLDEEVKFKLQGLQIEDDPTSKSVKLIVQPGEKKGIKLKKTLNEFSIGFSTGYLVKVAK